MDEQQIQDRLRQNIPQPNDPQTPTEETIDSSVGQAIVGAEYHLDDMTQYKLHDFFGVRYKPSDEITKQQAEYIFKSISESIGETDYSLVVSRARDIERMIGTQNRSDRMYRLYQWLKLDSMRRNIDRQMGALSYE